MRSQWSTSQRLFSAHDLQVLFRVVKMSIKNPRRGYSFQFFRLGSWRAFRAAWLCASWRVGPSPFRTETGIVVSRAKHWTRPMVDRSSRIFNQYFCCISRTYWCQERRRKIGAGLSTRATAWWDPKRTRLLNQKGCFSVIDSLFVVKSMTVFGRD